MLFVRLLVAIADLARAVKAEARAAVLREEPHFLARQQRRAIDQVTKREIARTALESRVNRHLDRDRLALVVGRHYRLVQLPVMKIEPITRAVIGQRRTKWDGQFLGSFLFGHFFLLLGWGLLFKRAQVAPQLQRGLQAVGENRGFTINGAYS